MVGSEQQTCAACLTPGPPSTVRVPKALCMTPSPCARPPAPVCVPRPLCASPSPCMRPPAPVRDPRPLCVSPGPCVCPLAPVRIPWPLCASPSPCARPPAPVHVPRPLCASPRPCAKNNHTKYEPKTQGWQPGTGVATGGPPFQTDNLGPKVVLFLLKTALQPVQKGKTKGSGGYTPHAA